MFVTVSAGLSSELEYAGTGISHFVEHMIFKGTQKRKAGDIEKEVKSYGGSVNAFTDLDSTSYHMTVPARNIEPAIGLMEDIVFNPAFDPVETEKEKEVILKEIGLDKDDPSICVTRRLWQAAYLAHPYKEPVIGYEELFRNIQRDDLVKYHKMRYAPQNMIVTVAGDVDTDGVLALIKVAFGKHKRQRGFAEAVPREPEQVSVRETENFTPINLGYIAMGYHTVESNNSDLYALDVLGIILGEWDGSRLQRRLVKTDRLLYAVTTYNYTPRYPGLFIIYGVGDYSSLEKATDEILEEIKKISASGLEKNELDAAKNIVIANYINTMETTDGIAKAISQSEFLTGDPLFFERYVEGVKAVDAEAVKSAAGKYLREGNLTVSYLYPEYAKKAKDLSKPEIASGEPIKKVLPNGLRLILKEDHRLPKISLAAVFIGGLRAETKDNNGISNLTSVLLLKGTKERSENKIQPFLESMGGRISPFSGYNTFGIAMEFPSEHKEAALDVFSDIIKNPIFPEEELEKEKEKVYAAIKAEDDDVYDTGFLKMRRALFGDYPYSMRTIGEAESVKNIKRPDIESFCKRFVTSKNMVLAVVGDFESAAMSAEIEKCLRGMDQETIALESPELSPLSGLETVSIAMPREQSLEVFGFRGATFKNNDRYCLEVLSSILSGENGRLYQSARNKSGLAYALGTFQVPGIDTGYIASYIATDEAHLEEAKKILLNEFRDILNRDPVRDDEIALARAELIGRQAISLQSYGALAYQMALDETYGVGYAAYRNYPDIISGITKNNVADAVKEYIDLKKLVEVSLRGAKK